MNATNDVACRDHVWRGTGGPRKTPASAQDPEMTPASARGSVWFAKTRSNNPDDSSAPSARSIIGRESTTPPLTSHATAGPAWRFAPADGALNSSPERKTMNGRATPRDGGSGGGAHLLEASPRHRRVRVARRRVARARLSQERDACASRGGSRGSCEDDDEGVAR